MKLFAHCSGPNDKIQAVIDNGVCRRIVELLMNNQQVVETFMTLKKSLLFLECGLCGSQSSRQHRHWRRYPDSGGLLFLSSYLDLIIWQVIINCGALPCLLQLLSAPKESIRKEVETTKLEISEMMLTGDVMTLYCQIPHFLLLPQLES